MGAPQEQLEQATSCRTYEFQELTANALTMAITMSYVVGQPQFEPDKPPFRPTRTIWSALHPAFGLAYCPRSVKASFLSTCNNQTNCSVLIL